MTNPDKKEEEFFDKFCIESEVGNGSKKTRIKNKEELDQKFMNLCIEGLEGTLWNDIQGEDADKMVRRITQILKIIAN